MGRSERGVLRMAVVLVFAAMATAGIVAVRTSFGSVGAAPSAGHLASSLAAAANPPETSVVQVTEAVATTTTTTTTSSAPPTTQAARPPTTKAAGSPPYAVTSRQFVLVDRSRAAPDRGVPPTAQFRTMRTVVLRPSHAPGPLPLVVFAHGFDSEPETYRPLLSAIAAAGYVVAAPELAGSAHALAGSPVRDISDQARDLSFVLTAMLDREGRAIDSTRVAAAGHSDGGSAVATLADNSAFRDQRFSAYAVLSGAIPDQVSEGSWRSGATSGELLVTVGDQDEYGNSSSSESVFDTSSLHGAFARVSPGDHSQMYLGGSGLAQSVRTMIVRFLDVATSHEHPRLSAATLGDGFAIRLR
jgi:dienelactone hydrolase